MSLDADTIVDRRRMRRKLTFWRVFAVLLAICAVVAVGAALRAPGTGMLTGAGRGDRARHHHRPDPQRSAAGRGAGAARRNRRRKAVIVHINSPGGTTVGLRAAVRFADAAEGAEADGGRGRRARGLRRLYRGDRAPTTSSRRRPRWSARSACCSSIPNVTELLKTLGIKVEEIKSSPLKAAPNGFEPTRPEARAAIEAIVIGFLCLVPRPGEGAPRSSTTPASTAWPTAASSPAARASRSSSSTSSATSAPRSPGSPRKRTSIRRRRCATIRLRDRLSDLPFLHTAAIAVLDAVGLGSFARRIEEWGARAGDRAAQP